MAAYQTLAGRAAPPRYDAAGHYIEPPIWSNRHVAQEMKRFHEAMKSNAIAGRQAMRGGSGGLVRGFNPGQSRDPEGRWN